MTKRSDLKTSSAASGAATARSGLSTPSIGHPVQAGPAYRRPQIAIPVPTPSPTPLLFNHSHRVFLWANELGRQTGEKFDVELLFISAAFHDLGLLKKFSSAADRFEVDSANAVRQFLEHHGVPDTRIQTAWDAISLHTTPGIAQYKQLEVELLFNGVGLDVLGIGYETFPEDLRKKVVAQFPRINFKQDIAKAFLGGFEHKTQSTEGTCNEDICSHFIRNYKRSNFYEQIQNSPFQNS